MGRKCSHCGNIGHNSRTCSTYNAHRSSSSSSSSSCAMASGLRLFGVQLDVSSSASATFNHMKKSFSLDCLISSASPSPSPSSSRLSAYSESFDKVSNGYLSDLGRPVPERKKGVPWTEEEHRSFLIGLEKLGKGDWRGISRTFVTTRTPTQVASHAQKYFLRQASLANKKRRSSLFDLVGSNSKKMMSSSDILDDLNSFGLGNESKKQYYIKPEEGSSSHQPGAGDFSAASGGGGGGGVAPPNLELTLAGPKPMLMGGPISVI